MTAPMDDTLTAIGRQLSTAYLPIVQEPLPRELKDLLAQLVASEMRKRDLITSLSSTSLKIHRLRKTSGFACRNGRGIGGAR